MRHELLPALLRRRGAHARVDVANDLKSRTIVNNGQKSEQVAVDVVAVQHVDDNFKVERVQGWRLGGRDGTGLRGRRAGVTTEPLYTVNDDRISPGTSKYLNENFPWLMSNFDVKSTDGGPRRAGVASGSGR